MNHAICLSFLRMGQKRLFFQKIFWFWQIAITDRPLPQIGQMLPDMTFFCQLEETSV